MATRKRVGILGYGALGKYLVEKIQTDASVSEKLELAFVWNRTVEVMHNDSSLPKAVILEKIEGFEPFKPDLGIVFKVSIRKTRKSKKEVFFLIFFKLLKYLIPTLQKTMLHFLLKLELISFVDLQLFSLKVRSSLLSMISFFFFLDSFSSFFFLFSLFFFTTHFFQLFSLMNSFFFSFFSFFFLFFFFFLRFLFQFSSFINCFFSSLEHVETQLRNLVQKKKNTGIYLPVGALYVLSSFFFTLLKGKEMKKI